MGVCRCVRGARDGLERKGGAERSAQHAHHWLPCWVGLAPMTFFVPSKYQDFAFLEFVCALCARTLLRHPARPLSLCLCISPLLPALSRLLPDMFNTSQRLTHSCCLVLVCSPFVLYVSLFGGLCMQQDLDPDTFLGAPPHVMQDVLRFIRVGFTYGGVPMYVCMQGVCFRWRCGPSCLRSSLLLACCSKKQLM